MPDINYTIRAFDAENAQIVVEVDGFGAPFAIDLPVGEDNSVPTGAELDAYIRGFIPVGFLARKEKLQAGVPNADDIAALVTPWPEPEPEPLEPPHEITMRQLVLGLAVDGWITWEEAEGWADRATLPAAVNAVIDQMPEEQRAAARITAKTMSVAVRNDPLLVGAAMAENPELSEQEINDLLADAFMRWAAL